MISRPRCRRRHAAFAAVLAVGASAAPALAGGSGGPAEAFWETPQVDRWFYPFNTTPGTRATMSLFGTTGESLFDDRDGQVLLRWDTGDLVPPGLGPGSYRVLSLRVTLTNATNGTVVYDETADPWTAYLPEGDPEATPDDPGSPLELFGVAGRNGFDPLTFPENGPYTPGDPIGTDIRNLHSITFDAGGGPVAVDNNVRDRFTPVPWAVGRIDGLAAGDPIPANAVFSFDVDLGLPGVADEFARQLDAGRVAVLVSSLQRVVQQGGDFVTAFAKESVQVQIGLLDAATLSIVWEPVTAPPCPEDVDGSGGVDFGDLLAVLAAFGPCGGCPADVDGSGSVDFTDLLGVLASFGPCPR
jgi:hypothetical protein